MKFGSANQQIHSGFYAELQQKEKWKSWHFTLTLHVRPTKWFRLEKALAGTPPIWFSNTNGSLGAVNSSIGVTFVVQHRTNIYGLHFLNVCATDTTTLHKFPKNFVFIKPRNVSLYAILNAYSLKMY